MIEKKQPIPARLYNASLGGHVAGAEDIIDDNLHQTQDKINDNTYRKSETYNKDEINNIISNTPETEAIVLDVAEGSTALDTLNEVPLADRPNKLFRVRNDTNTHYDEYGWTGTVWGLLASKDYGIDDEPKRNSTNLVTSAAVADIVVNEDLPNDYVYLLIDKAQHILLGFKANGDYTSALGLEVVDSNLPYVERKVSANGLVVSERKADGTLIEDCIEVRDLVLGSDGLSRLKLSLGVSSVACVDADGWEVSQASSDKAAVEKSKTLIDIEWTPKSNIPKTGKADKNGVIKMFLSGNQMSGIPYSGTQQTDKAVGFDVSIETFMTAVNNPYSLLYTECIRSDSQQYSAWGKEYNGIKSSGAYYGNVCSELSSCVAGLPFPSKTYTHKSLVGSLIGKMVPHNANSLNVGDIIWMSGHCIAISGIKKDAAGNTIGVIVSEQSSTVPRKSRRVVYEDRDDGEYIYPSDDDLTVTTFRKPFSDFASYMSSTKIIYRNLFYKDNYVKYHWDVDNEESYPYNNDICSFGGEKSCYREGELVVLNYGLEGHFDENGQWVSDYDGRWTHIELCKDDQLIGTYAIADIDQSALLEHSLDGDGNDVLSTPSMKGHSLVLGTGLAYGNYKARVVNAGSASKYTYFSVVQTEVSCSVDEENVTCTFSSANANAMGMRIVSTNGSVRKEIVFSEEVISDGEYVFPKDIISPTSFDSSYVKVYFDTPFGRVTNFPIPLGSGDDPDDPDD
ncbi:MAG: hypothetical protein IJQ13_04580 [Prevotella sp.]|nr:hypothetical protein [Prevotella sp.]